MEITDGAVGAPERAFSLASSVLPSWASRIALARVKVELIRKSQLTNRNALYVSLIAMRHSPHPVSIMAMPNAPNTTQHHIGVSMLLFRLSRTNFETTNVAERQNR